MCAQKQTWKSIRCHSNYTNKCCLLIKLLSSVKSSLPLLPLSNPLGSRYLPGFCFVKEVHAAITLSGSCGHAALGGRVLAGCVVPDPPLMHRDGRGSRCRTQPLLSSSLSVRHLLQMCYTDTQNPKQRSQLQRGVESNSEEPSALPRFPPFSCLPFPSNQLPQKSRLSGL